MDKKLHEGKKNVFSGYHLEQKSAIKQRSCERIDKF
jgi:hypothetical protein